MNAFITVWILVLNLDKHPTNLEAFTTAKTCEEYATKLRDSYWQYKGFVFIECQSMTVVK